MPVAPAGAGSPRRTRLARMLAAGIVAAAFVQNAAVTWDRWGDLIADTGRELDTPQQLLAGKVLYKDVRYWYGPLAPYANAALYAVFGAHVRVLTLAGLTTAALLAWASYRLVRCFTGRAAAAATAAALMYINAFPQYYQGNIFNFVLPYAYPATYGMLAAVASLYFLVRHLRNARRVDFLIAAALLGVTALCKLEVLLVTGAVHALFLVARPRQHPRLPLRQLLLGYLPAIGAPAAVYGWFLARAGPALWSENLFLRGNLEARRFLLEHSGLGDMGTALGYAAASAAGLTACLLVIWLAAALERRLRAREGAGNGLRGGMAALPFVATTALCFTAAAACVGICFYLGPVRLFRALPLLLAVVLLVHLFKLARRPSLRFSRDPKGSAPPAALAVGSRLDAPAKLAHALLYAAGLAGLARIALRSSAEHYGFYLLVPGVIAFAVFWAGTVPALAGKGTQLFYRSGWKGASHKRTTSPFPRSRSAYVAALAMLAAAAFMHEEATRMNVAEAYGPQVVRVRTPHGTLPCLRGYVGAVDEAVRYLSRWPGTTAVVMPEGAAVAFLAGCVNPLGVHTFLPLDLPSPTEDAAMTARLAAAAPDFIVLDTRDTREYGKEGLGIDYGQQIMHWVTTHYTLIKRFESPYYAVAILQRK